MTEQVPLTEKDKYKTSPPHHEDQDIFFGSTTPIIGQLSSLKYHSDDEDHGYGSREHSLGSSESLLSAGHETTCLIQPEEHLNHDVQSAGMATVPLLPPSSSPPPPPHNRPEASMPRGDANVTWLSLPRKDQLAILTLARLAEPLAQTSLQSYMFFMLKSFNGSLSDAEISSQTGFMSSSFTFAQALTAVWWGRFADKESMGRKNVIIIGLVGTSLSTLAFGFSRSFTTALIARFIGGALNGNVGVMRTMISEIIKEKKFQPKAFLILPMTFNVGVLLGPLLGGWLQDPARLYPKVFGPGSTIGGQNGVQWMIDFPYALPNILMSSIFVLSIALVVFGLEETHIDRRGRPDPCIALRKWLLRLVCRPFSSRPSSQHYNVLDDDTVRDRPQDIELATQPAHGTTTPKFDADDTVPTAPKRRPRLPYRRIFTPNLLFTFLAQSLVHIHVSSFSTLWFIFLSTPRFDPAHPEPPSHTSQQLPFAFTGGLGLPPQTIGFAIGIIGFIGLAMQFGVYSRVVSRLGVVMTFRLAMACSFPFVYLLVPYLAVIPTRAPTPAPADGPVLWVVITALLFLQVVGRTFVLPIGQILINNCTPHPSVLGTVHGIGQSVSSFSRTIGPVAWSTLYGWGLRKGIVGIAWWSLAVEALIGAGGSWLLYEGTGHEIWLEGDEQ